MNKALNITNGDSAVEIMRQANIPGTFLPWQDVLHEGPVPAGLSLQELSSVRAQFIASRGWGTVENTKQLFRTRDATLESFERFEKVILWFEHDLYDQLQLLQVLDWFHHNRPVTAPLSMICTDRYLGTLSAEEMTSLFQFETAVTEEQLELASKGWSAFRSSSPRAWHALLDEDTSVLPFLKGAVIRLLEEYPACSNGLSRTAHTALGIIYQGEKKPGRVFGKYQASEDRRFMGDASFWVMLQELLDSSPPLLTLTGVKALKLPATPEVQLMITPMGQDILSGKRNWLETAEIDRWIGGVHLTHAHTWCWDGNAAELRLTAIQG